MMLAVPKTSVPGQMKPFFWLLEHISGMLVNIQAWTPSCVVPAMTVAMTCAQNMDLVKNGS
jgi:hypothetical protein